MGEDARIRHYKIQNDHAQSHYIGATQVYQQTRSTYDNLTVSLDGGLIRNNLTIRLDGEHIEANMYGLYMLRGESHVDNHSAVDHCQPNSVSNELYKGILDDRSTGVFNGKIFVRKYAQKTNAYQQNRNVLLSDSATINTKPQLEIWADDVKCSHGATTGSLDTNALFYLQSRGVPEREARSLLIYAFGYEVVEKINLVYLRNYLDNLITKRLGIDQKGTNFE
ncbi:MAG: Fe-S cluster assembly protein SufD [Bacteroidia bacterium]|nr:Fe-S cluster assembly protein SufD [Bacteroidia bacterium]